MNEASDHFYICVYLEEGRPIGHRGASSPDFPNKISDRSEEKSSENDPAMEKIWEQFFHTMMGYLDYVPLILDLAPMVSHRMVTESLQKFLEKSCVSCDRSATRVIYKFDSSNFDALRRFEENLRAASSTSRALPRLLTVGLVTSLEFHVALLMKEIAVRFPEEIFRERSILVREAIKFASMEELKDQALNEEIDRVQRDNFESQIGWIVKKTPNMDDFTSKYPDWSKVIELFERRNLFVHANGIVNNQYLSAHTKHKFPDADKLLLGDELHAGSDYYSASVNQVIHFGAMLFQVVWRKIAPDETEAADKAISDLGYELIVRGRYKLAIRILEFARSLRDVSEELRRRTNIVNLANAYKLSGNKAKSLEVLSSMDWGAVSSAFQICVAAVKDEVDEVVKLMLKMGKDEVSVQEFQDWPVFYSIREDARFLNAFKELFAIEFIPSAKRQAGVAQVLKWAKEQALAPEPDDEEFQANVNSAEKRTLN